MGVFGYFGPSKPLSSALTEKDIAMLKSLQNIQTTKTGLLKVLFGAAALIALVSATPVAPAHAQGAPAGLLRLDSSQPSNDGVRLSDEQRAKVRNSYARARKHQAN